MDIAITSIMERFLGRNKTVIRSSSTLARRISSSAMQKSSAMALCSDVYNWCCCFPGHLCSFFTASALTMRDTGVTQFKLNAPRLSRYPWSLRSDSIIAFTLAN
jgi:hypothetical protein